MITAKNLSVPGNCAENGTVNRPTKCVPATKRTVRISKASYVLEIAISGVDASALTRFALIMVRGRRTDEHATGGKGLYKERASPAPLLQCISSLSNTSDITIGSIPGYHRVWSSDRDQYGSRKVAGSTAGWLCWGV